MSDMRLPGLATGLDTSTIIQQLMAIERRPIKVMESNKARQNQVLERLRLLNTKLQALQTAAKKVMGSGTEASSGFGAKSASSSNTAVFTASASTDATPGTYQISNVVLAQAQKAGGNAFTGATMASTLQITNGVNTANITINPGDTATTIAANINGDANSGMAASVVGGRLVLTGKNTGAAEQYTITETAGSGNLLNEIGLQAAGTDVAASDASLTIAGVNVTSSTNTFTNALNGVTINAVTAAAGPETLTVTKDQSVAVNAVKDMVAKYNDIINQVATDTKYNAGTKTGGPLIGDNFVRTLVTNMNRMVTDAYDPADSINYTTVGISVQRDGTLTLDETKLTAALNANPTQVYDFFAREDGAVDGGDPLVKLNQGANGALKGDGIANRLNAMVDQVISANSGWNYRTAGGTRYEGSLLNRLNSAEQLIDNIDDRIENQERRLELREKTLRRQFVAMESAVSLLRSQGSYLAGQFSGGMASG